jgi:hypothetical protein
MRGSAWLAALAFAAARRCQRYALVRWFAMTAMLWHLHASLLLDGLKLPCCACSAVLRWSQLQ